MDATLVSSEPDLMTATDYTDAPRQGAGGDYRRMARAIHFLREHRGEAPSLAEVAAAVDLSPHHFQRLFSRWAGVSPKRFLQYLTLAKARELLRNGRSVLDTTYELNLSGPSRLHDLFVSIDAMTPGEHKQGGAGLVIDTAEIPSPFGHCLLGLTERGVCWLSFSDQSGHEDGLRQLRDTWPDAELRTDSSARSRVEEVAEAIFGDEPLAAGETPSINVLVHGTNFQLKVWEALLRIPSGQVVSYGDLACAVGKTPKASRAVGSAVGANPVSFLIPCHRVLRSMGTVSGYRWGPDRKRAILAWEGARANA
ncbi:MAG: methylated-DNA--[protein]-cysteine S-methyltransferase [Thermoanaerobaculia bacterium]|nr:methylated-DNA--[protein]-cysteine S-methyltransferase [Thermoanaerobaculia bacterium]